MRLLYGLIFLPLFIVQVQGQNLVPNPSFETYTQCPDNQAQIDSAVGWFSPTGNTPDYFNACYTGTNLFHPSVPVNYLGHEYARTGNAYAGIASYSCPFGSDCRDYISAQLTQPLQANVRYCVSFYVSLADSSLDAIAPIGAYFSNTLINDQTTIYYLPVTPQVNSSLQPLDDIADWMLITGSFVATGGESYILIGTFSSDAQMEIDSVRDNGQPFQHFAYYYIDDVSVVKIADCIAGNDAVICFGDSLQLGVSPIAGVTYAWLPDTGLYISTISNPIVFPSVTTTYTLTQTECDVVSTATVTIIVRNDCNNSPYSRIIFAPSPTDGSTNVYYDLAEGGMLEVYDLLGRLVWKDELPPGDRREYIWLPLSNGLYCWRVRSGETYAGQGKIEIIRQ